MNRRDFLQKGSSAALIAAGLPMAIRTVSQNRPSVYKNELLSGKAGQTQYIVTLLHSSVEKLSLAQPTEKMLGLQVKFFETTDLVTPTRSGDFKYSIESCEQTDTANNIWKVKTNFVEKISGNYEFNKDFPKDMKFVVKPYSYTDILSKKDKAIISLPYVTPSSATSDDEDCFLTTACVKHKNLKDDCEELQTLRHLRDNFMLQSSEGKQLVEQYASVGPEIVAAIASCDNSSEIYEYMHKHMIIPSVELVKQGEYKKAEMLYSLFVAGLKAKYC